VLTKLDVNDDPPFVWEAEASRDGRPVHAVSNLTGEGVDELDAYLRRARRFVLLGSSGVGKSTLVNRLAGRELMTTGDLRNDGRGRHTTRARQLARAAGTARS
jgi:ribosome biogenesis GTPase